MRVQKTVDGIVHNYYYSDGLLTREEIVYNENYSQTIDFLYDESGLPYSFIYNTYQYYYIKNLQGDVVAIVDNYGYLAAEYTYDAWGNVIDITEYFMEEIGAANPIRYRSYYYDTETGFYYLQSRYYDPAIRRFINADGYVNANGDILGFNMYAYCGNNPVMYVDYTGEAWYHWAIGAAVVIGFAALTIATCGGSLVAAGTAVGMVASGSAAFTTASTVAAAGFIGSATVYGGAVLSTALESESVEEFCEKGDIGVVVGTTLGGVIGSSCAYSSLNAQNNSSKSSGSPGAPFKEGQRAGSPPQIGVDPNTLKLNTSIHPGKYNAAKAKILSEGMYGTIEVYSNGVVYNGNHRVYIARELNIAVDVIVKYN